VRKFVLFFAAILLLIAALPARAQTFQTAYQCASGSASCILNSTSFSVTAGWNAVVMVSDATYTAGTFSVSDTNGDTFSACAGPVSISSSLIGELFCVNFGTTNSTEAVTCSVSSSAGYLACGITIYSGGYNVVDQHQTSTTSSASSNLTSGATPTTTAASELVVGGFLSDGANSYTYTATGGYTLRGGSRTSFHTDDMELEDLNVSSTGAQTATATVSTSTTSVGLVVTLKAGSTPAAAPTLTIGTGTYSTNQSPVASTTTTGTVILCWNFGSSPATPVTNGLGTGCTNGTSLANGGTLSITATGTLKIVAGSSANSDSTVTSAVYTMQGAAPSISPGVGVYPNGQLITLTPPSGFGACYSTSGTPISNGSGGCTSGTLYSSPFSLGSNVTTQRLYAISIKSGWTDSTVATQASAIPTAVSETGTTVTVTSNLNPGVNVPITVVSAVPTGYNGTFLTTSSNSTSYTYTAASGLGTVTTLPGAVQTSYDLYPQLAVPTISPDGGSFTGPQSVTLSCGGTCCYTTDGSTPTEANNQCINGTTYSSPFNTITSGTETLNVLGTSSGSADNTATATFTISEATAATPTSSLAAGAYFLSQTGVTLSDATSGAAITYCTDTTNTCTPGTSYSSSLTVSSTEYLRAQATATGYNNSAVASYYYVIAPADQTGSYAFSDNFQNYENANAKDGFQLAFDAWNTAGQWTAGGTAPTYNTGVATILDVTRGGSNVQLTQYGNAELAFATFTGATGFTAGQYSKAYVHNGTGTGPQCVFVYASTSGDPATGTAYAFCVNPPSSTAGLYKLVSDSPSSMASASSLTIADGSTIELRALPGQIQPLLNGAAVSGWSSVYNDSTYTSGNPGVSGAGIYNWTGGTINATSAPTAITWGGATYSTHGPFAWTSSSDTSSATWPWNSSTAALVEVPTIGVYVLNTGVSANGTTVTLTSTLNPGVGASVEVSGMSPVTLNGVFTTTASSSSSFSYANTTTGWAISSITESGTTATVSTGLPLLSIGATIVITGATPSGYNGAFLITGGSGGAWTFTAASGLGTASVNGTAFMAGQAALQSASVYALGSATADGIKQEHYLSAFSPAQYILATVALDVTSTTVQNWFLKINGNSGIPGTGCYDLIGYYIGVEPMWQQNGGAPPYPNACSGTSEYCGTMWLHITKDTPATQVGGPVGGCNTTPNFNVWTVAGSLYLPMAGDHILVMYQPNGYLDVFCKGTARSAAAPFGDGCPSTASFTRVMHVYDSDMLGSTPAGNSLGFPGVWAAINHGGTSMSVFQNVTVGSVTSGVTCASITGGACLTPTTYIPMSFIE
jgi:hypothetical protein